MGVRAASKTTLRARLENFREIMPYLSIVEIDCAKAFYTGNVYQAAAPGRSYISENVVVCIPV